MTVWILLTSLVWALPPETLPATPNAEEIFAIPEGRTHSVTGPAVVMGEPRFRRYVVDSRSLQACSEGLDQARDKLDTAILEVVDANTRALKARDIARAQFSFDETLILNQRDQIALLGAQLDQESKKNSQLRNQRNIAWAIAGGFLAASATATVLALSR